MKSTSIESAIEALSRRGFHIAESWLRKNKNRTLIPRLERIPVVCNECGSVRENTMGNVYSKKRCPRCHQQQLIDKRFGAGHVKILEYRGSCEYSKLYCTHLGIEFERRINDMTKGDSSCICSGRYHTWKEMKNEASSRGYEILDSHHKDEDIIGVEEKLTLLCEKHGPFESSFSRFYNRGNGCPKCGYEIVSEKRRATKEEAQSKIDEVHGKGRYIVGDDYFSMNTNCHLLCTKCGETRLVKLANVIHNGNHCPCETESKGESFTSSFLDYMNLRYEKQVKFANCRYKKPLPFDFKVYNSDGTWFLLEFDGIQHFTEVPHWGGKKALKETRKRDRIKNRFCEKNKIFLIRIQNKKQGFRLGDRERVIKALEKAGNIMAFLSEINRKHSWVITVEI